GADRPSNRERADLACPVGKPLVRAMDLHTIFSGLSRRLLYRRIGSSLAPLAGLQGSVTPGVGMNQIGMPLNEALHFQFQPEQAMKTVQAEGPVGPPACVA